MSKVCEICGKRPVSGNNVSHAHNITKRRFNPNLQRIRALVNGVPKRMRVCTSCLKAGKITKRTNFSMPKRKATSAPAPAPDSE